MELSKYVSDGTTVITLCGELDSSTAPRTHGSLEELLPEEGTVVLDLSGMSYMSSAGLRVLLLAHRRAQRNGVGLVLASIPEEVRMTMSATGFLEFFTVAGSVAEGVGVLSG
ncbi:MAG TPA: STAS domain-containing protein [Pseudonocardiaceae bacterium]|nr:STAS domain-containing protein [Pseudonocardiaceae bacterium]